MAVLFRSVGKTGTDLSGSETMSIVGSTLTASAAMSDVIGLGDAITWNDGADQLAFIHGRTSSTVFTVKDKDGGVPTAASAGQAFGVFRCYTSLKNWEAQVENANIVEPTENDVNPPLDLATAVDQLDVACYADAADVDSTNMSGWTTDAVSFIRIKTPVTESEVGVSQRHKGKFSTTEGCVIDLTTGQSDGFNCHVPHTKFEGLQIRSNESSGTNHHGIHEESDVASGTITIDDCIVVGNFSGTAEGTFGIAKDGDGDVLVQNTVLNDWARSGSTNTQAFISGTPSSGKFVIHNCTVDGSRVSFRRRGAASFILKNAISKNSVDNDVVGTLDATSSHNVFEVVAEGAFGATHSTGTATTDTLNKLVDTGATFITDGVQVGSIVENVTDGLFGSVTAIDSETSLSLDGDVFPDGNEVYSVYTNMLGSVTFKDEAGDDFHLGPTDTVARNKGKDLSADTDLAVTLDIDGDARPIGPAYDVGADELRSMLESVERHFPRGVDRGILRGVG